MEPEQQIERDAGGDDESQALQLFEVRKQRCIGGGQAQQVAGCDDPQRSKRGIEQCRAQGREPARWMERTC